MNASNKWLIGTVSILVLLGVGYGTARLTDPHRDGVNAGEAHAAEGHAEEERAEDAHAEDAHTEGEEHVDGDGHAEDEHGAEDDHGDEEGLVVLSQEQLAAANIAIVSVQRGGGAETRISGRVEATPDALAIVGAVVSGAVEQLLVAPGDSVEAGQPLARITSGEGAALAADMAAAIAEAEAASLALEREQRLLDQGVVAQQSYETSRAQAASATARANAARARAAAAGNPDPLGGASIAAPIAGVVTSLRISPGGFVQQGQAVATITNPDQVELVFSAPPSLAASVHAGDTITAQAVGGAQYVAEVTAVAPDASEASGATQIRARADGTLPPVGSAITGYVVTDAVGALTVPSEAVQTVDGGTVVFIADDEGFRPAPVLVGRQAGGRTEILNGLAGDERIAGANAFLLKAELAKGEAGHGH